MFHKTVHKTWNLFKLSEQSLKILQKNPIHDFWLVKNYFRSIECSFDRLNRNQAAIKTSRNFRIFIYHFNQSSQSFDRSKILNFEFSLKKFQNLIFTLTTLWNNILRTQTSLLQPIHVCTYIYNTFVTLDSSIVTLDSTNITSDRTFVAHLVVPYFFSHIWQFYCYIG